ncbi:biotin/lipoyl-binding carrier protein [bacterium]|jgi:acetyl-CoA carboxylase biotin carboxyl carrier protein|nr:biotin/lipoyl-binding carrier protein [Acidimicrobiaceae bacterium]MCH9803143.1 biotin/lipoyl-binding carrier protein [bacterium]MDB4818333.1 biotin/lipoyl-binding carrier protein [Acidimicrobiales bacterium]MBT6446087.1 biotin/lipoyl-binding carrier protein [Acidimicrobiaceae bacterium]MCO4832365.1 biotin/lipoyl-binding carrier protein [Acidimicrobiaceae bacterium]
MSTPVKSPVVGTVWKIQVAVGDTVAEGDEIMILESMKMEIPIEADAAGVVASLAVAEGDTIADRQLLATID